MSGSKVKDAQRADAKRREASGVAAAARVCRQLLLSGRCVSLRRSAPLLSTLYNVRHVPIEVRIEI